MKNDTFKRVLSFFMALVMFFEMVPTSVLSVSAADDVCAHHTHSTDVCAYREEVVCTHEHDSSCYAVDCVHTSCDDSCGYREEIPGVDCNCGAEEGMEHATECSFREMVPGSECLHTCSKNSGCVAETPNCDHTEDGSCCYVAAQACNYICQECLNLQNLEDSELDKDENDDVQPEVDKETDPVCNCGEGEKCTADQVKVDCEVCASGISGCKGTVMIPEPSCNCGEGEKCTADQVKVDCEVCASDISGCKGTAVIPEPSCNCGEGEKCTTDQVKVDCEVCGTDISGCKGTVVIPEPPAECVCEYRCESDEDAANCAVCSVDDAWEKCAKEPKQETDEDAEEVVSGFFSIQWDNASHSGNVPDISGDVRVLDTNGVAVDGSVVKADDGYIVSGLLSSGSYTLTLSPDENSVYTVSGSNSADMVYDSENKFFEAEDFTASLNTYTLSYKIVWPEDEEAPEDFDTSISLGGAVLDLEEEVTENGYQVSDLYEVDGDYTLVLPEVEELTTDSYAVAFNSKTEQPLVITYGKDAFTAEFVIYWNDAKNASGRRTMESMEDMLTIQTDDGAVLSDLTITGEKLEYSEIEDYEKYIYTVVGIDAEVGSLELIWDSDALLGYDALLSDDNVALTEGFEPMQLTRGEGENVFTSDKAYALVLPQYHVTLNVSGLMDHTAQWRQAFLDGIQITWMDLVEMEEHPFTEFTTEVEDGVITIGGLLANSLYQIDDEYEEYDVYPSYYTITWPKYVDDFILGEEYDESAVIFDEGMAKKLTSAEDLKDSMTTDIPLGYAEREAYQFAYKVEGLPNAQQTKFNLQVKCGDAEYTNYQVRYDVGSAATKIDHLYKEDDGNSLTYTISWRANIDGYVCVSHENASIEISDDLAEPVIIRYEKKYPFSYKIEGLPAEFKEGCTPTFSQGGQVCTEQPTITEADGVYTVDGLQATDEQGNILTYTVNWPEKIDEYQCVLPQNASVTISSGITEPVTVRYEKKYAFIFDVEGLTDELKKDFVLTVKCGDEDCTNKLHIHKTEGRYHIEGLSATDKDGNKLTYILSWPETLGDGEYISLPVGTTSHEITDEKQYQNLKITYAKKIMASEEKAESVRPYVWFDTNNEYTHEGQLVLSVPVTVAGKTIEITPQWDEEQEAYVHTWTAEDLVDLGISTGDANDTARILAELEPLVVKDEGDNNLNRTLTATTTRELTVPNEDGSARNSLAVFEIGQIEITDVNYTPSQGDLVVDYAIGTYVDDHSLLTLYPLTNVEFNFDIRAGETEALDVLNYLSAEQAVQLQLKDSAGFSNSWCDGPIGAGYFENNFGLTDLEWKTSAIGTKKASYYLQIPLYDRNKQQIEYAFNTSNGRDKIDLETGDWYRVEYDNTTVPGHGTHTDRAYEDGNLIFILTGNTGFKAKKVWEDDGKPETIAARPQATYTLWRYTKNGGSYATAAMLEIPLGDTSEDHQNIDTNQNPFYIELDEELEKYDSDGYPYVYFIRENLPANSGYEKIYGEVEPGPEGEVKDGTDPLPYNGNRKKDDTSVYDGGTITNRRTDTKTLTATKKWIAAYYQDQLENLSVELKLWAKHKDDVADAEDSGQQHNQPFVVKTETLTGFDAFNDTKAVSVTVDKYDAHGHELIYWWEESAVIEGNERIPVEATANSGEIDFTLPMNEATMDRESYSETSKESFKANVRQDTNGNATVTNKLVGNTEYWVKKTWEKGMDPDDVTVYLHQVDKEGNVTFFPNEADSDYEISKNLGEGTVYTGSKQTGFKSIWIKAYQDLPKYDANGNLYSYIVTENKGNYQTYVNYGNNVDTDTAIEANSVLIENHPIGISKTMDVRKIWLDDSANTDRGPVKFNVYTKSNILLYGTENGTVGLISSDPVVVDQNNEWMKPGIDVTLFKVEDKLVRRDDVQIPKEYNTTEKELAYLQSLLYEDGFYVKEISVDGNSVLTDQANRTDAGYSTVTNGNTKFAVIYNGNQPKEYTNIEDDEGFYTVTNLRIGVTNLTITKKWEDDGHVDRDAFEATMTVYCEEETTEDPRITSVGGKGYAEVSTVVNSSGKLPITNSAGTHVNSTQEIYTKTVTDTITFNNLPLYDDQGKILHYFVREHMPEDAADPDKPGKYHISSSDLEFEDSVHGVVQGTQTFTNTFKNTTSIYFDLLWLDDYRITNQQRPDVYLHLFHTKWLYDDAGNPVMENGVHKSIIERHDFKEYEWKGTNNDKKTEDWWRYTFTGLDEYDAHGNKIDYYGVVQTHANREILDYIPPQYAAGGAVDSYEDYLSKTQSKVEKNEDDGKYEVSHNTTLENSIIGQFEKDADDTDLKTSFVMKSGNTFVLQLKNDTTVLGHKVWEKIPQGFPVNDLPLLSFKLYRHKTTTEATPDSQNASGEITDGICVAAILNYQSPSRDYTFQMNYMGINDHQGNLIPATQTVTDLNGDQDTALAVWHDMTGLDEALYGTPLSKYDGYGEMYKYSIIEIIANSDKGTNIDVAYEELTSSVNGYNIINTYNITTTNARPIKVKKAFTYNGAAVGSDFQYPDGIDFELYRFYKIDYDETERVPVYTTPELINTQTLTAAEAENAETKTFGGGKGTDPNQHLVYAPNGNPYIYYIAEKVIYGYNNNENNETNYPIMQLVGTSAKFVTGETGVYHWPNLNNSAEYWYSNAFTLEGNQADDEAAAEMDVGNDYTALPQVEASGTKTWIDYSNIFGSRLDENTLTLELYRKTASIAKHKVADVTFHNQNKSATVEVATENGASLNVSSEIADNEVICEVNVTSNAQKMTEDWSFTVKYLDGIAPTGEEWEYSFEENTVPTGYDKTVSGNDLTNKSMTSFKVTKDWQGVNETIQLPEVTVALQVSEDNGATWRYALGYFDGMATQAQMQSAFGADYANKYFVRKLNNSNSWQATFNNLPKAAGDATNVTLLKYRAIETQIGGVQIQYNDTDTTNNPQGVITVGTDENQIVIYSSVIGTNKVENTPAVVDLSVEKVWEQDNNNAFDTRYVKANGDWEVKFHVYRTYDDAVKPEPVMKPNGKDPYVLTITGGDTDERKTEKLENLPAYSPDGKKYDYFAVEIDVNADGTLGGDIEDDENRFYGGYDVKHDHTVENQTTVTNKLILTELEVTKNWEDDNNTAIRPTDLTLKLMQNGSDVSDKYPKSINWNGKDTDKWTVSYVELPKYDSNEQEYEYTVTEEQLPGYKPAVIEGGKNQTTDNQTQVVTNSITCFELDKIASDDETQKLGPVTLTISSKNAIASPNLGEGVSKFYTLVWSRDEDEKVGWFIYYGDEQNSLTNRRGFGSGNTIYGMPEGTYVVTAENPIPDGYWFSAKNAEFTLSNDGNVKQTVTFNEEHMSGSDETDQAAAKLNIKNKPTSFNLVKQDSAGQPIAADWVFSIVPVQGSTFADGSTTARTFDEETEVQTKVFNVSTSTTKHIYALTETQNPPGYQKFTGTVYFKLNDQNQIVFTDAAGDESAVVVNNNLKLNGNDFNPVATENSNGVAMLLFKDPPFQIVVNKLSTEKTQDGEDIVIQQGATFELYDITKGVDQKSEVKLIDTIDEKTGEVLTTKAIVTNGGSITISSTATSPKLLTGHKYRLIETVAPVDYELAQTAPYVDFTIADDGTLSNVSCNGDSSQDGNSLTFKDQPIYLELIKYDHGGRDIDKAPLKDVTFTLKDETTGKSQTKKTGTDGKITIGAGGMFSGIVGGHIYTLTETRPTGYKSIAPISFRVETWGDITLVEKVNDTFVNREGTVPDDNVNNSITDWVYTVVRQEADNFVRLEADNERMPCIVEIVKKNSDTQEPIDNITFKLYREKDPENQTWFDRFLQMITGYKYVLAAEFDWNDVTVTNGTNVTITPTVDKNNDHVPGLIRIEGLDWGRYKMVETVADGYKLPSKTYYFDITAADAEVGYKSFQGTQEDIQNGVIYNDPNKLLVYKVDENGNKITPKKNGNTIIDQGAEFKLFRIVNADEQTEITNVSGTSNVWVWDTNTGVGTASYLSPGTYKIVETNVPGGYTKGNDITFTIDTAGVVRSTDVTVRDENGIPLINYEDDTFSVTLEKKSTGTNGKALAGAVFKIYDVTAGVSNKTPVVLDSRNPIVTAGTDGKIVIKSTDTNPNLKIGNTYLFEEVIAPAGYEITQDHPDVTVTINDNGTLSKVGEDHVTVNENTSTFTFTDEPISLQLVKWNNGDRSYSRREMANVTFKVYDHTDPMPDNQPNGVVTTNDEGIITFGADQDFVVIGGHIYTLEEQTPTGYYEIAPISFRVETWGDIQLVEKNAQGEFVNATDVPNKSNEDVVNTEDIPDWAVTKVALTAENVRKPGSVEFTKRDTYADLNKNGITFELYREDNPEPQTWLDRILQMITGKKYVLTAAFDWEAENVENTTGVTVTDIAGVNGADSGKILIEGLDWGNYKLVETVADGYMLPNDPELRTYPFSVTPENAGTTQKIGQKIVDQEAIIENTPNRLAVTKKDENGDQLAGATFVLKRLGDNGTATVITETSGTSNVWTWDINGSGEARYLSAGTYRLEETEVPAGYTKADDITFTVDTAGVFRVNGQTLPVDDNVAQLDVDNEPFQIRIKKISTDHVNPSGAVFKIYDVTNGVDQKNPVVLKNGNSIVNTGSDDIVINSLDTQPALQINHTYVIEEETAPAGYEVTAAHAVTFSVSEKGVVTNASASKVVNVTDNSFVFVDKPIELTLVKYDGGDYGTKVRYDFVNPGEFTEFKALNKLSGIKFTLTENDQPNNKQEATTTDGKITFGPGKMFRVVGGKTYTLTEEDTAGKGYNEVAPFSFTVNYDGTITLPEGTPNAVTKDDDGTTLRVVNERILGKVKLYKFGAFENGYYNLNDAEFSLYRRPDNSDWIEILKNFLTGKKYELVWNSADKSLSKDPEKPQGEENEKGELLITNLPWGTYKLVETKAPDGYKLEERIYEFVIGPDNPEQMIYLEQGSGDVVNNPFSVSFGKYRKNGSNAGTPLEGAVFKLQEKIEDNWVDIETTQCLISGADGIVTVNSLELNGAEPTAILKADGTLYRVVEIKAPRGYELPVNADRMTPFVEFKFKQDGTIERLSGFSAVKFNLDADNNIAFGFLDEPIELTLKKRDGGDRSAEETFLEGVEFQILDANGNAFADLAEGSTDKVTTGADGTIKLPHIYQIMNGKSVCVFPVGGETYQLRETKVNGYEQLSNIQFTVKTDGMVDGLPGENETLPNVQFVNGNGKGSASGADEIITVVNQRILGTVKLKKTDEDKRLLNDIHFKLYRENVSESLLDKLKDFVTGKTYTLTAEFDWENPSDGMISEGNGTKGVLTIKDLDWGKYKLVETYADGYVLDTKDESSRTYEFEIGPDDEEENIFLNVNLDVTNRPNRVIVHKVAEGEDNPLIGAQYNLYYVDKDGKETKVATPATTDFAPKPIWDWDSKTGTGEGFRLNMGTYKLVETRSPYGYVIAAPIEFTIDQNGKVEITKGKARLEEVTEKLEAVTEEAEDETVQTVIVPVIKAEDKQTIFQFTKEELFHESCYEDALDTRILPGVTFTAYEDEDLTKVIATAVSDDDGVVTFIGLPLKDYKGVGTETPVYIKETATVPGHVLDENVYMVYVDSTLNDKGEVINNAVLLNADEEAMEDNTVINDVFRADFRFTKVSELDNTKVIPGAEYGLYKIVKLDLFGKLQVPYEIEVATAVANKNGVVVFEGLLMDTEYTVRELSVPAGSYLSANDIKFSFKWNINEKKAELTILDDGDDTITEATAKDKIQGLLWQEPQVVVSILKVTSSKKPLDGATLQIRDRHGKVIPVLDINGKQVKSWVSTKEAHIVSGILEAGETYWLHELDAPSGFVRARAVKFTIPDKALEPGENFLVKVMMINHRVEEAPKTGDNIMIAGSVMTFSAAALVVLLMLKKKKR